LPCSGSKIEARIDTCLKELARKEAELREFSIERAEVLYRLGRLGDALRVLDRLDEEPTGERTLCRAVLRTRTLLKLCEFNEAEKALDEARRLAPEPGGDEYVRDLFFRFLFFREDLEGVEKEIRRVFAIASDSPSARLAEADWKYQLLRFNDALEAYRKLWESSAPAYFRSRALAGMGLSELRLNRFDSAYERFEEAILQFPVEDATVAYAAFAEIKRGRIGEAVSLFERAVSLNPWNESALSMLGNGYSRHNYTELGSICPELFPGAEDAVRGSAAWAEGDLEGAITAFRRALDLCGFYGRAANGLAKALESKRRAVNVHRHAYEEAFAKAALPGIPGLRAFVVNFDSLAPRHQKSVALSIAPWKQFVPVLVESGATYYIKPLHEKLSECPEMETLRDLRVSYDGRLWDDVRGAGGFHTVTGIEDVEATIDGGYNTVLHELTHQVHRLFTPEENRIIRDAYRQAKKKEAAGKKVFLSSYQGSSEWEYFAEGANAYFTEKRDDYDTREIRRDRLDKMDPHLRKLVEKFLAVRDVSRYYATGLTGAAYDRLGKEKPAEAAERIEKAYSRAPQDESVLNALSLIESIRGRSAKAVEAGETSVRLHPKSPDACLALAAARLAAEGRFQAPIEVLEKARRRIPRRFRQAIDAALGDYYLGAGDLGKARRAFEEVLELQADSPEGLWGLARVSAFGGRRKEAAGLFEKALRVRSGILELRIDYAHFLLDSGDLETAKKQVEAARMLVPSSTHVEAAGGRAALLEGNLEEAEAHFAAALKVAPWNDLARILRGGTRLREGKYAEAEKELMEVLTQSEGDRLPAYVYDRNSAFYVLVHTFPARERKLLHETLTGLCEKTGREEEAKKYGKRAASAFRE
jgi:tetratricopeptide (TPR) repeat protein